MLTFLLHILPIQKSRKNMLKLNDRVELINTLYKFSQCQAENLITRLNCSNKSSNRCSSGCNNKNSNECSSGCSSGLKKGYKRRHSKQDQLTMHISYYQKMN